MSKSNKIFNSIPLTVPDRSGFDLSHEVLSSATCGTVIPLSWMEVLPGDTISVGGQMKVTLPPFSVPFMGRIDAEINAFFVPNRLLWEGWKPFIMRNTGVGTSNASIQGSSVAADSIPNSVPLIALGYQDVGPNSLASYLGIKSRIGNSYTGYFNALPFLAYHLICDNWFRVSEVTRPFFPEWLDYVRYNINSQTAYNRLALQGRFLPYSMYAGFDTNGSSSNILSPGIADASTIANSQTYGGKLAQLIDTTLTLNSLRQRPWAKDYFTTATFQPQSGPEASVVFDTSGNTGSFSIATLRAANSLQKWRERNNLAGAEYDLMQLAHWGCVPPDSALNRSVLLGSIREPVYVGSVENTSDATPNDQGARNSNPYGPIIGSAAGFGSSMGKGSLVDNFTSKEYGILMFTFTLIPHAYYASGIRREFVHRYFGDFAWPELANIGDQAIYESELNADSWNEERFFGYQQRYCEYKFMPDIVTGVLNRRVTRTPNASSGSGSVNMDVYALQRYVDQASEMQISSDFVEIPKSFLDQVTNVNLDLSGFNCLIDAFFDARALRVLPEFSLPSL